jgi:hypothetical protein
LIVGIVGGAAVVVGSFMSWNRFTVGPLGFSGKSGLAGSSFWVALLGGLLIIRIVVGLRNPNASRRLAAAPLITAGIILVVAIQYAVTLRHNLTTWLLGPESTAIAQRVGRTPAEVSATIKGWLDSGQSHLTLSPGFWLVVGGAVVAAAAVALNLFQTRPSASSLSPAAHREAGWEPPG